MALVETLAIKLGGAVARGLLQLLPAELRWSQDALGGLVDDGSKQLTSFRDQRRIRRQIEGVEELVAGKLFDVIAAEFPTLAHGDRVAAVDAAGETFKAVDALRRDTLFEVGLDPEALRQHLLLVDRDRPTEAHLSDASTDLYHLLIRESCNYLISLVQQISGYEKVLLKQVYQKEMELVSLSKAILDRIPERSGEVEETEEARLQYLRDLTRRLDTVRIYGLDVPHAYRSYALNTSWIDLRGIWVSSDRIEGGSGRMVDMLTSTQRVIVQGPAGSGKTTLVRWISVEMARGRLDGPLRKWSGLTPVYIPVRKIMRDGDVLTLEAVMHQVSPSANAFIESFVSGGVTTTSPSLLFLLDGLDEVSEEGREHVLQWIEDQLERYPECGFVITTRPPTVGALWATKNGFEVSEILPLTLAEMEKLVRRWYGTQSEREDLDDDDRSTLATLRNSLLLHLDNSAATQDLAKTPLLCALLCALNLDRKGLLPSDRLDLYRVALSSLLLRRDAERMVEWTTKSPVTANDMAALLESLAWWMSLNDRASITLHEFETVIAGRLPVLRNVEATADEVAAFLLLRSGVLRSPDEVSVDFIHKSFQEFLAAKAAVDGHHLDLLVGRASTENWFNTIAMACGHANSVQRQQLLTGLLEAGDAATAASTVPGLARAHAVAAMCLQYAAAVEPELVSNVESRLAGLVPPRGPDEMSLLIASGTAAIELIGDFLAPTTDVPDVLRCLTVLRAVGGDSALQHLRQIGSWFGRDDRVLIALIDAALSYEKDDYVDAVFGRDLMTRHLAGLTPEQAAVADRIDWLNSYEVIQPLHHEDSASEIGGRYTFHKANVLMISLQDALDLSALAQYPRVERVVVTGAATLRSFAGLQRCPAVSRVELMDANAIASLSAIALPKLTAVDVRGGNLAPIDREVLRRRGVVVNEQTS